MCENNISEINVLQNLDNIIFVADAKTKKIIFTNEYTKKKFGICSEKYCFNLISGNPDLTKCSFKNNEKCCDSLITGTSSSKEHFNKLSKSYYEIQSSKKLTENGTEVIIGTMVDITRRKQYEETLKYNEQLFRSIFESYIDVFFQTTLKGNITIISPSCAELTGYTQDELLGVNIESLLIDNTSTGRLMDEVISLGKIREKALVLIRKDSYKQPVILDWRISYDNNGEPIHIDGVIKDNSNRLKTEDKLREAAEKAIEAHRMRNEFIANMNHELRTPLNGILGYTQLLKSDRDISEKQLSGMEIIERSANHLLGLINDILDLSKIEAGKMEFQFATFNLQDLLKSIYEMISVRGRKKNIGIILNKKTVLPDVVIGDKKRLGQVLLNLLTNAVKFTDFGTVTLNVAYRKGKLEFEVIDTGFGIPSDKLESIFQPFNQLSEHTHKSQGTGLGLSISQRIVNKLGGEISVQSELGRGSKFSVKIPMEKADEDYFKNTEDNHNIVGYDGTTKQIIIVDDEANDRKLLKAMLHPKGFEIVEATDGIDVLKFVEKSIPDLILLDFLMPQLDGFELTRELRSKEETKHIPIIIITAYVPDEIKSKFEGLAISEFLMKPVDEKTILSAIKKTLTLSWNYVTEEDKLLNKAGDFEKKEKISYPDREKIDILYKLVNRRNFSVLYETLNEIEQENKAYIPFVKKIRKLADMFNSNQIRLELQKIEEELNAPANTKA